MKAVLPMLVIGGGMVGVCCALALQRRGLQTTLLDAGRLEATASWGNAGHIATEQVSPLASAESLLALPRRLFCCGGPVSLPPTSIAHWLPFGIRLLRTSGSRRHAQGTTALTALLADALPAWQRVLSLARRAELLRASGHHVVWESARTAEMGLKNWRSKPTGTATLRACDAHELESLQAQTRVPLFGGITFANTGQITHLAKAHAAIRAAFESRGGQMLVGNATALHTHPSHVDIQSPQGNIAAQRVVVACGVQSESLMEPLGIRTPMIAERGYHIESQVTSEQWPADSAPLVFEDRSIIATRFEGHLRLAGFTEFSHPNAAPDARKWQRLQTHATQLGLPIKQSNASRWMGNRPTLPDYLPAIGPVNTRSGSGRLFAAYGHQHLGVTLAAITAERVADTVLTGDTNGVSAFSPLRFS